MENTTLSQCSCGHCGHIIDFPASEAGKVVECPKCKEKSQLPEAATQLTEETQEPSPAVRNCPACGVEVKSRDRSCLNCESIRKKKFRLVCSLVSAFVVLLVGVIWFCLRHSKPAEKEANLAQPGKVMLAQPQVKMPKTINDLKPGRFFLEQKRGSDLVMATGDIENTSGNVYHGLKVELDLLDATGAKIGTVNDLASELGPRQTWHFLARVTEPKAMSVRFASIKEDQ